MAGKKDINKFATTYLRLYMEQNPPQKMLMETFGEACRALGFQADLGESFMRLYSGDAFYEAEAFDRIADTIDDPYVLGTAIFSRWRLVTQWEAASMLTDDKRAWFHAALGRLAELTADSEPERNSLSGRIENVLIVSNNTHGVPGSAMSGGVEQRVSISATGEVTFAFTQHNADPGGHTVASRPPRITLSRDQAGQIMASIGAAFPYLSPGEVTASGLAAAPGTWNLIATNQWGRPYRMSDELGARIIVDGTDISDMIRDFTGNNELLLFDGNPDLVSRVEVQYRRGIPAQGQGSNVDEETVQWTYFERLVFDRRTDTMEHYLDAGPGRQVHTTAQLQGAVSDFLDTLDPEHGFTEPEGNPPDAVFPTDEIASYQIVVVTRYGNTRMIHGTYDARSLPPEWGAFVDRVLTFIGFFGFGEIFDEARYGRALRRESDYVYALAEPEGGLEPQWFLSDTPEIQDNDIVIVPYGDSGEPHTGRVRQVVYGSREDAPQDFDLMPRILRVAHHDGRAVVPSDA